MKKLLLALLVLAIMVPSMVFAVGTATAVFQRVMVQGNPDRLILTISWTDDNAGTTYSIVPATYRIEGYYLYSVETNPGAGPPTDNYDITILDADGFDVAGSVLLNRDTSTTELVNIGTATHGYPVIRGTWTFTIAAGTAGASSGTAILTFTAN
jgi:hypothetical protein